MPQDLMDHVRRAHNVPGEIKKVSLETLFPPWTLTCYVYMDSLTSRHSGISNDVQLQKLYVTAARSSATAYGSAYRGRVA